MSKPPWNSSTGALVLSRPRSHAGNGACKLLPVWRGEVDADQIDHPGVPSGQDAPLDSNEASFAQRVDGAAGRGGGEPGTLSRRTYGGQAKGRSCQCCESQCLAAGQVGDVRGITQLSTKGLELIRGEPDTSPRAFGWLNTSPQQGTLHTRDTGSKLQGGLSRRCQTSVHFVTL